MSWRRAKEKHRRRRRLQPFEYAFAAVLLLCALFVAWNLWAILAGGIPHLGRALASAETRFALRLSLITTTVSSLLCMALAIPSAYCITSAPLPGRRFLRTLVELPMSLPYLVLGLALLTVFSSPFGKALTPWQCIQYALDKPGVLTVLPGIRDVRDAEAAAAFCGAPEAERDYSVLGTFTPRDITGTCVYCNHCQPCPAGLNVGLINKYYDLALAGDPLAAGHYRKLEKKASACVSCGHCDSRCPFHVPQSARMKEIAAHFGE